MNCPATSPSATAECEAQKDNPLRLRFALQPKAAPDGKVELEKIRRELLTLASRVEKLAKGQEQA